jgi:hypothetical protein
LYLPGLFQCRGVFQDSTTKQLYLIKLYLSEKDLEKTKDSLVDLRQKIEEAQISHQEHVDELNQKMREVKELHRDAKKMEAKIMIEVCLDLGNFYIGHY